MRSIWSGTTPGNFMMVVAILLAGLATGCSQEGGPTEPDGEVTTPLLTHKNDKPHGKPGGSTSPGSQPETFLVSIETMGGSPSWTTNELVQNAAHKDWLHVYDSGGNGTRGNPDYRNAAFVTGIHLQPGDRTSCFDPDDASAPFNEELWGKLDGIGIDGPVVFDFQVGYDIADNPDGFSFFLFRWKEADDRVFSAKINNLGVVSIPTPSIDFLGDNEEPIEDIRDSTKDRVFQISNSLVVAQELQGRKVIATLACDNEHVIDVTVSPVP